MMLIHAEEVCDKDKWISATSPHMNLLRHFIIIFQKCVAVFIFHNIRNVYKTELLLSFFLNANSGSILDVNIQTEQRDDSHLGKGLRPRILTCNSGDGGTCSIEVVAPGTQESFLIRCYHLSTYLSPVGSVKQAYYTIPTPPFFVSVENYSFSVPE